MNPETPNSNPIANFEGGTVFLHARWSGPSVLALQHLRRAWSAAGLSDSELHVLDLDEQMSMLRELPELFGKVHGYGEAFHVRSGSITYFQALGRGRAGTTVEGEIQSFVEKARNV